MARTQSRIPDHERVLRPVRRLCPACGGAMRIRYENRRTLVTLSGTVRLHLKVRRCESTSCVRYHRPYRPEAEGALALPQHEFGLDVVALVGALRHRDHRSVPEIHAVLTARGVAIDPNFEADRHAKKELKKQVRGIRRIERGVEERDDAPAALVQ